MPVIQTSAGKPNYATGIYSGNAGPTETITLSFAPKLVFITQSGQCASRDTIGAFTYFYDLVGGATATAAGITFSGNTFIVDKNGTLDLNDDGSNYLYMAWG